MILNRLIFPEGNKLVFNVDHHENEKKYELARDEMYYMVISEPVEPFTVKETFLSDSNHFAVYSSLKEGEYVFEIGITDSSLQRRIILPAVDERHRPLNQLLILRRLVE